MHMDELLVFTTAGSPDVARRIAMGLVENHEAACVSIIPGLRSIYRWQGEICDDGEWLLLIKSSRSRFEDVRARIRGLHSYDVPEIVAVPLTDGDPAYLQWLNDQLQAPRTRAPL
jgi:periplasmic divalent cation tolerance protein